MSALLRLTIEIDRETDGRWIAVIPDLPGVMAYGQTEKEAIEAAKAIAFVEIGDRLQHGEPIPGVSSPSGVEFVAA
jgi:predicted RNase H-like HicB family nuclease